MKRNPLFWVVALAFVCGAVVSLTGQEIGATAEAVEAGSGKPSMKRQSGDREVWMYADGRRITFRNGAVSAVEGPASEGIVLSGVARQSAVSEVPVAPGGMPSAPPEVLPAPALVSAPRREPAVSQMAVTDADEAEAMDLPEEGVPLLPVVLGVVALLVLVAGNIWFLVLAFREGFWWGVGCLCLPVVPLVFAHRRWDEVKKPFCLSALAAGLLIGANALF